MQKSNLFSQEASNAESVAVKREAVDGLKSPQMPIKNPALTQGNETTLQWIAGCQKGREGKVGLKNLTGLRENTSVSYLLMDFLPVFVSPMAGGERKDGARERRGNSEGSGHWQAGNYSI